MEAYFITTVFLAGLFSFFSPCIIPLLPVYFSILSSTDALDQDNSLHRKKQLLIKSSLFVCGISTSFILLGFGAGILGAIFNTSLFHTAAGLFIIVLGLHQCGLIRIPLLYREKKLSAFSIHRHPYISTYFLGFTFSFGWTPCIGPILGAILALSATAGTVYYSVFLMGIYAVGLMLPFLLLAIFSDTLLQKIPLLNKHLEKIKALGGIVIILMGILFLSGQLNRLTALFV